jgi:hypothetical protein
VFTTTDTKSARDMGASGFLGTLLEFGFWQASYAAQGDIKGKAL